MYKIAFALLLCAQSLSAGQGLSSLLDGSVTMRTGAVYSSRYVDRIVSQLKVLARSHPRILVGFYYLCRAQGGTLSQAETQVLVDMDLISRDGQQRCQVDEGVCDVVVSCITIKDKHIEFRSPYPGIWCPCFGTQDEPLLSKQR